MHKGNLGKNLLKLFGVVAAWLGTTSGLPSIGITLPIALAQYGTIVILAVTIIYLFAWPPIRKRIPSQNKAKQLQEAQTSIDSVGTTPKATLSSSATVVASNPLPYYNPFDLEDLKSTIAAILIMGVLLWLSYQLQNSFPTSVIQILSNLTLSLWIIFGGAILIFSIVLSAFIRAFFSRRKP